MSSLKADYNNLALKRELLIDKLRLANERDFNGGKPLFKSLQDGLREIRFAAYPGGAIRILFKALSNSKQAVLLGFIKKSDRDGYRENMPKALNLFKKL